MDLKNYSLPTLNPKTYPLPTCKTEIESVKDEIRRNRAIFTNRAHFKDLSVQRRCEIAWAGVKLGRCVQKLSYWRSQGVEGCETPGMDQAAKDMEYAVRGTLEPSKGKGVKRGTEEMEQEDEQDDEEQLAWENMMETEEGLERWRQQMEKEAEEGDNEELKDIFKRARHGDGQ